MHSAASGIMLRAQPWLHLNCGTLRGCDCSAAAQIAALEDEKAEAQAEARALAAELESLRSEPSPAAPVGSHTVYPGS